MTFLNFKPDEFFNYLKKHGCKRYSNEYLEKDNIILFKKDDIIIPIQLRKTYYPFYVCKICRDFNIKIPKSFLKVKKQMDYIMSKSKRSSK